MSTPSTWTGSEETRKDTSTLSESWKKVHTSKGERGLESAHFVGHSLGGRVAAELAAEDPDCVSKMVLADAAGVAARRGKLGRLAGVSGEISQTPAKLLEPVVKGTLKAGVTEVIRVADHLAEEDIEGKLT